MHQLFYGKDSPYLSTAKNQNCPNGWAYFDNRCFKYNAAERNYKDSVNYCKSQDGSIATIHSAKENGVVAKLAMTVAYIGAESDGQGHWKWSDGSKWWQPAQEDTDGLAGRSETRIAINPGDHNNWHDWGTGSDMLGVICAKAASTATGLYLCMHVYI